VNCAGTRDATEGICIGWVRLRRRELPLPGVPSLSVVGPSRTPVADS
jgi:hypothetical protein